MCRLGSVEALGPCWLAAPTPLAGRSGLCRACPRIAAAPTSDLVAARVVGSLAVWPTWDRCTVVSIST